MKQKISIIIPAYNEEKRIGKTLEEYGKFFKNLKKQKILDFEILIVINNTTDKTEEIVKKFLRKFKEIKYLNFEQKGKGFAIIEGFKDALKRKNDLIGFVDADMATSPEAFYDLVENIKDYDGIIASRWIKGSKVTKRTFLRVVTSVGFNFIVRSLFLINHRDTQCGVKIFKRKIIEKIIPGLNLTQWAFDVDVLYLCKKYGFKIKEYPTIWKDKADSKINSLKIPLQMFCGVMRLKIANSFLKRFLKPMEFLLIPLKAIINKM